ncbi:YciI family protein [Bartonella tamiae]|uniref:YCII-related domain-containing protein n=1 Tax=Bartonella tamiae Th239 TaxID=1094558 RepID=J0R746_9HYPH|nr:YciI family protein [Bartonella tamiae]EJF91549.1 hypothetical protein ME5_00244 [Bartonella tamiae Th239]EJF92467.1 hypothetical protein MEG_01637 [Bartonella tamiae Th307]
MYYAVTCIDKKDHLNLRLTTRPEHLTYLKNLDDVLKIAGPFMDENGQPNGTLMVIEASSLKEAQSIAENDPYARAGLFDKTDIRTWNWTINNPKVEA